MAISEHPNGHSPEHHNYSNGFDPLKEWFGIPKEQRPITYYMLLGVPAGASDAEIRAAASTRDQSLTEHLTGPHAQQAKKLLDKCITAEQLLLDPTRRAHYDRILGVGVHEEGGQFSQAVYDQIAAEIPALSTHIQEEVASKLPEIPAWRRRAQPLIDRLPPRAKRLVEAHIGKIAAGIAAGVTAIAGLTYVASHPEMLSRSDKGTAAAPTAPQIPEAPVRSRRAYEGTYTPLPNEDAISDRPAPDSRNNPGAAASASITGTPPSEHADEVPASEPAAAASLATPTSKNAPPAAPVDAEINPEAVTPAAIPQPVVFTTSMPQQSAAPARKAIPSQEELKQFSDLPTNRTLATKAADALVAEARRAPNAAEQWSLFDLALKRAREDGNVEKAMQILDEMQHTFISDGAIVTERARTLLAIAGSRSADKDAVTRHACGVIGELCRLGKFDEARKLHTFLQSKPAINRKGVAEASRLAAQWQKACEDQGIPGHERTLRDAPEDAAAVQAVALFRCFDLGDWSSVGALCGSDNDAVKNLAQRINDRASASAVDLHQLAQDLLAWQTPPRPGAIAMAIECCASAKIKAASSAVLAARVHDLQANLLQRHAGILPFLPTVQTSPAAAPQPPSSDAMQQLLAASALPAGTVNLMEGTPTDLLQRGFVVRPRWQVAQENGREELQGMSGHQAWVASVNFPLNSESKDIVKNGNYVCRFVFSRTPEGRREGTIQGASTFMIPLPNGKSIGFLWDGNMDKKTKEEGYRSGFDPAGASFHDPMTDKSAFIDHPRPIVSEDGKEHLCLVTVHTHPNGFSIKARIAHLQDRILISEFVIAAPLNMEGNRYLLEENGSRMPTEKGSPWGAGVGGGTMQLREAQILPSRREPQSSTR